MSNANANTYGKLMELMKEVTALEDSEIIQLVFWVYQNQNALISRVKESLDSNHTEEQMFTEFFKDAPSVPDYKTVIENIEAKLITLLDKVAGLIEVWLGCALADKFRTSVAKAVVEFKNSGQTTDWKVKFETVKAQLEALIPVKTVAEKIELTQSMEPAKVSDAVPQKPAPVRMSPVELARMKVRAAAMV